MLVEGDAACSGDLNFWRWQIAEGWWGVQVGGTLQGLHVG